MPRTILHWLSCATLALTLLLVLAATADACPMCKVALAGDDGAHGDVIGGFFWSILFMLSMPFAILGSFSGYMYLLVRRARAQQGARPGDTADTPGAPVRAQASHGQPSA